MDAGLLIDPLSMVFVLLITGVGSLIHIYAIGYMAHDDGRRRFFGYFNFFTAVMLLLVLANSYLGLYVGWEGVGLASYLLISYYFNRNIAATAGNKAFFANRVGDVGLSIAIMLMFAYLGSTSYADVLSTPLTAGVAAAIGFMLLLGACGKSGSVPAADLAARRHGGPDAGVGAHPRRHDGHRRRLPHRALGADLRPVAGGAHRGRRRRRDHVAVRLHLRLRRRTTSSACSRTPRSARSATCSSPSGSARACTRSGSSTCSATASSRPRCSSPPGRSCTR